MIEYFSISSVLTTCFPKKLSSVRSYAEYVPPKHEDFYYIKKNIL